MYRREGGERGESLRESEGERKRKKDSEGKSEMKRHWLGTRRVKERERERKRREKMVCAQPHLVCSIDVCPGDNERGDEIRIPPFSSFMQ
jgi:hypothetical protein